MVLSYQNPSLVPSGQKISTRLIILNKINVSSIVIKFDLLKCFGQWMLSPLAHKITVGILVSHFNSSVKNDWHFGSSDLSFDKKARGDPLTGHWWW